MFRTLRRQSLPRFRRLLVYNVSEDEAVHLTEYLRIATEAMGASHSLRVLGLWAS